ncbi:MAG: hypothetical protein NC543_06335 [bacterium]|nr:hypothetical protein [bacterium]
MLEQKDLEMIAHVVGKAVEPVIKDVGELKEDVVQLRVNVDGLKEDVSELKEDVVQLKEDVDGLKEDVSELKEDVIQLKEDVDGLKEDVNELNKEGGQTKKDIKEIRLTLENEMNRNIRLIAEGHLDLNRKLNDALKVENEKEMMGVRVNLLEGEVRRLKEKVATIA